MRAQTLQEHGKFAAIAHRNIGGLAIGTDGSQLRRGTARKHSRTGLRRRGARSGGAKLKSSAGHEALAPSKIKSNPLEKDSGQCAECSAPRVEP